MSTDPKTKPLATPSPGRAPVISLKLAYARMRSFWVPAQEVRAETWALGGRHQGRVIEGALIEGKAPGVGFRRAILLQAVIRERRRSAGGKAELALALS